MSTVTEKNFLIKKYINSRYQKKKERERKLFKINARLWVTLTWEGRVPLQIIYCKEFLLVRQLQHLLGTGVQPALSQTRRAGPSTHCLLPVHKAWWNWEFGSFDSNDRARLCLLPIKSGLIVCVCLSFYFSGNALSCILEEYQCAMD